MRAQLSPVASVPATDPALFDAAIRGVMLTFNFGSKEHLAAGVRWTDARPPTLESSHRGPTIPIEERRFLGPQGEVNVLAFARDLVTQEFVLTSLEATSRESGYGQMMYRAKFILHPKPLSANLSVEQQKYIAEVGVPSLTRAVSQAVWTVDCLRNPLRDGTGFGFALACKARMPYRLSNGEQNMFRNAPVKPAATLRVIEGRVVLV